MRPRLLLLACACLALTACARRGPEMGSGVAGAGTGPSTMAANGSSPGQNRQGGRDSNQNNNGPNAGGPH